MHNDIITYILNLLSYLSDIIVIITQAAVIIDYIDTVVV